MMWNPVQYFFVFEMICYIHDDITIWKHFPCYWPFVSRTHRSPLNSPHKGPWRGALMFSLIIYWTNDRTSIRDTRDLRCHRSRYDGTVMHTYVFCHFCPLIWCQCVPYKSYVQWSDNIYQSYGCNRIHTRRHGTRNIMNERLPWREPQNHVKMWHIYHISIQQQCQKSLRNYQEYLHKIASNVSQCIKSQLMCLYKSNKNLADYLVSAVLQWGSWENGQTSCSRSKVTQISQEWRSSTTRSSPRIRYFQLSWIIWVNRYFLGKASS